jgi:hypothetical protein
MSGPKYGFGTDDRFQRMTRHLGDESELPGPGSYSSDSTLGSNRSSRLTTQPAFGFGSSNRDHSSKVFISPLHAKSGGGSAYAFPRPDPCDNRAVPQIPALRSPSPCACSSPPSTRPSTASLPTCSPLLASPLPFVLQVCIHSRAECLLASQLDRGAGDFTWPQRAFVGLRQGQSLQQPPVRERHPRARFVRHLMCLLGAVRFPDHEIADLGGAGSWSHTGKRASCCTAQPANGEVSVLCRVLCRGEEWCSLC